MGDKHPAWSLVPAYSDEDGSRSDDDAPVPTMTTISDHPFRDADAGGFTIHVIENMQEDYGMFVWPCSIALAEYVWQQRTRFSGTSMVELGAGTSLPGLVGAKVGAHVVLTDRSEVLENMRRTCELNKINGEVC